MKRFIAFAIICTLGLGSLVAGEGSSLFGFRGKVFIDYTGGKCVTVNLYDGNRKISSYVTGANGKFLLDVASNRHYTLELEKEGYITKRIVIDTKVSSKDAIGVKEFKFDVELLKKTEEKDYSILDFPITILQFNIITKEFEFNKKYTKQMLSIQDEFIEEPEDDFEIASK